MTALPRITTPEAVAEHMGWSPRRVRKLAREIGACRIMGNRMVLLDEDVTAILEATRPSPSKSNSAAVSDTTNARSPDGGYKDLQKLRARKLPSDSGGE